MIPRAPRHCLCFGVLHHCPLSTGPGILAPLSVLPLISVLFAELRVCFCTAPCCFDYSSFVA